MAKYLVMRKTSNFNLLKNETKYSYDVIDEFEEISYNKAKERFQECIESENGLFEGEEYFLLEEKEWTYVSYEFGEYIY